MTALSLRQQQRLGLSPKGRRGAKPPNKLPALEFWYDAAESPVVETAGAVERLDDLSGNANHAGQASAGARPIKTLDAAGRNVIRFDGSDDSLEVTTPPSFASGLTVFVVFRMRQRTDFDAILSASAAAGTDHVDFFTLQNASAASGKFQLFGRSIDSDTLLWQLTDDGGLSYAIFALGDGSGIFRALDGSATDTYDGSFGTPDEIVLGARFNSGVFGHAQVDLLEVGLYSRKLSDNQVDGLEAYLLAKYEPLLGMQAEHDFTGPDLLSPDWTFTRASTARVRTHEEIWRVAASGELRHQGLRRVRNLYPSSAAPATQVVAVNANRRYAFYFRDGGGSGSFALTGAATATVAEGEAFSFVAASSTLTCTLSGSPGATATVQLEETTGSANAAPSEYVDSATAYNAVAPGVRYFTTTNGNSFTAPGPGAVTDGDGVDIDSALIKGALLEPERTNYVDYTFDITKWSGTTVNALDQEGIGGVANRASTVTDNSAGALLQANRNTIAIPAASQLCTSFMIKKDANTTVFPLLSALDYGGGIGRAGVILNTATGACVSWTNGPIIQDYGCLDRGDWWLAWVTITSGAGTTGRPQIWPAWTDTLMQDIGSTASLTRSVVVGNVQVEVGLKPTSPLPNSTNGGTVTRLADILTLPAPGVAPGAIGIEMGLELPHSPAGLTATLRLFGSDAAAGTTEEIRTLGSSAWAWTPETGDKGGALEIDVADLAAETVHTLGLSLTDSEQVAVFDGTTELDDSQSLSLAHSDVELQLGFWDGSGAAQMPPGVALRSFRYWTRDVVRSRIGG